MKEHLYQTLNDLVELKGRIISMEELTRLLQNVNNRMGQESIANLYTMLLNEFDEQLSQLINRVDNWSRKAE